MAKPIKIPREEMSSERRDHNQARTDLALIAMSLIEIRQRRQPADTNGASGLTGDAFPVAKASANRQTELHDDMLLSTLKHVIAEMGGTLKLVAQFPEEEM